MSRTRNRFVPRLQAFDDRIVPAVTAEVLEGTSILMISGDIAANTITIQDGGQLGGLVVQGDGQTFSFSEEVHAIIVNTGDDNDTVTYNLTAPLTTTRSIVVDLGKGNDFFTANLPGQTLQAWANLDISAYGQGGKDTLVLNANNVSTQMGSILNVYFEGGAGKDTIHLNYTPVGEVSGEVFLTKRS